MTNIGFHFEGSPDLKDFEDPSYYMMMPYKPECQAVVMLSSVSGKPTNQEKVRWLDLHLSHMQCPYPIRQIEFTYNGDAVVMFISSSALKKGLSRSPLKWNSQEVVVRQCNEDDIKGLYWVGISGTPLDLYPFVKQALKQFGEVKGEYAPHPNMGSGVGGMLKYYFVPGKRKRLPPTIQFIRPDRPKGFPPTTVKVFTPDGAFSPKCIDFGSSHSQYGCPECFRRKISFRD